MNVGRPFSIAILAHSGIVRATNLDITYGYSNATYAGSYQEPPLTPRSKVTGDGDVCQLWCLTPPTSHVSRVWVLQRPPGHGS